MISLDLSGKVAVVTGCTQGLGLGIAKMMAEAGCTIAGCGRSSPDNPKAVNFQKEVNLRKSDAYYLTTDIRDEDQVKSFVSKVYQRFGRIDFLISNAGVNRFTNPESCSPDFWDENFELNLKSHWVIAKACHSHLEKSHGVVILMTSNHAYVTLPDCFPYNVAKTGIKGLVRALAVQWGPAIRVIGLAPGFIQTEGGEKWFNSFSNPDEKKKEVTNIHPVKRIGTVEEVGGFCAFLCSQYAGFITGTTYLMDGGRSAVMQDI